MDFGIAFQDGNFKEKACMELPEGFRDPRIPNLIFRSPKVFFGLRQASGRWYAKFTTSSQKRSNSKTARTN